MNIKFTQIYARINIAFSKNIWWYGEILQGNVKILSLLNLQIVGKEDLLLLKDEYDCAFSKMFQKFYSHAWEKVFQKKKYVAREKVTVLVKISLVYTIDKASGFQAFLLLEEKEF